MFRKSTGAECGFDAGVDLGLGKLGCHADAVHDGFFVRRSVPNDADATNAKQRGAAVLRVVEALLEVIERAAQESRAPTCDVTVDFSASRSSR